MPLPTDEQKTILDSLDWRDTCLRILHAVGEAEGVWFELDWDLPDDIIQAIDAEFDRWRLTHKDADKYKAWMIRRDADSKVIPKYRGI